MAKAKFGSKIGLIAATVGSAVGLGNIWRFPAEAQANGGAAFLIVYIACVFVLGIPMMLSELSLGRGTQSDTVSAFSRLRPNTPWWLTGVIGLVASYLILSFYMVVAGWTFEYLWQSVTGGLFEGYDNGGEPLAGFFHEQMEQFVTTDFNPLINTYILIALNITVLLAGVQKGIERISTWLMPLLFLLLLVFCAVSLNLPKASEGLSFFLHPDFSKITPGVIVDALGQAFFSLSLGMGILITYGSYFPKSTKLTKTAVTVSMLDLLVAVMMGIIIFPAVASFGMSDSELRGTTLVFVTLPEIFAQMPATRLWSVLFFLLLFVAALTSTISLGEVSIAFVEDHFKRSRKIACLLVMIPLFGLSALCSLSFGSLSTLTVGGLTIFNLLDTVATNYMLPVCALLVSLFIGWAAPRNFLINELTPPGQPCLMVYRLILFLVKWIVPGLILIVLLSSIQSS